MPLILIVLPRILKNSKACRIKTKATQFTAHTCYLNAKIRSTSKIVSKRLGHSTVAFTLDTYSHVVPGLQEAAAKAFDMSIKNSIDSSV